MYSCRVGNTRSHAEAFPDTEFEVLIGAAKILGETFEMMVAEVLESEGFELSAKYAARNTTN